MQGTDTTTRECITMTFKDSPVNLMKESAIDLGLKISAAMLTIIAVIG